MKNDLLRELVSLLVEDHNAWREATKDISYYKNARDTPDERDAWAKSGGNVKRAWQSHADINYFKSLTKIHWIQSGFWREEIIPALGRILTANGRDEIAVSGFRKGEKIISDWGDVGVVLSGHPTLAASHMDSIYSGQMPPISSKQYKNLFDRYKNSGIPRYPRQFHGGYTKIGTDEATFQPGGDSEIILDNWEPIAIVINSTWNDWVEEEAEGITKNKTRVFELSKKYGIPVVDINLTPILEKDMQPTNEVKAFIKDVLNEQEQKPLYTGVVVDAIDTMKMKREISKQQLDKSLPGWIKTQISRAHGNQQLNHHMTISLGAIKQTNPLRMRLNQNVTLRIVGWGFDKELGVAAWQVDPLAGFAVKSGVPHITAMMRDETIKPFKAGKIKNWKKLEEPFSVTGSFVEVFPKQVHI